MCCARVRMGSWGSHKSFETQPKGHSKSFDVTLMGLPICTNQCCDGLAGCVTRGATTTNRNAKRPSWTPPPHWGNGCIILGDRDETSASWPSVHVAEVQLPRLYNLGFHVQDFGVRSNVQYMLSRHIRLRVFVCPVWDFGFRVSGLGFHVPAKDLVKSVCGLGPRPSGLNSTFNHIHTTLNRIQETRDPKPCLLHRIHKT